MHQKGFNTLGSQTYPPIDPPPLANRQAMPGNSSRLEKRSVTPFPEHSLDYSNLHPRPSVKKQVAQSYVLPTALNSGYPSHYPQRGYPMKYSLHQQPASKTPHPYPSYSPAAYAYAHPPSFHSGVGSNKVLPYTAPYPLHPNNGEASYAHKTAPSSPYKAFNKRGVWANAETHTAVDDIAPLSLLTFPRDVKKPLYWQTATTLPVAPRTAFYSGRVDASTQVAPTYNTRSDYNTQTTHQATNYYSLSFDPAASSHMPQASIHHGAMGLTPHKTTQHLVATTAQRSTLSYDSGPRPLRPQQATPVWTPQTMAHPWVGEGLNAGMGTITMGYEGAFASDIHNGVDQRTRIAPRDNNTAFDPSFKDAGGYLSMPLPATALAPSKGRYSHLHTSEWEGQPKATPKMEGGVHLAYNAAHMINPNEPASGSKIPSFNAEVMKSRIQSGIPSVRLSYPKKQVPDATTYVSMGGSTAPSPLNVSTVATDGISEAEVSQEATPVSVHSVASHAPPQRPKFQSATLNVVVPSTTVDTAPVNARDKSPHPKATQVTKSHPSPSPIPTGLSAGSPSYPSIGASTVTYPPQFTAENKRPLYTDTSETHVVFGQSNWQAAASSPPNSNATQQTPLNPPIRSLDPKDEKQPSFSHLPSLVSPAMTTDALYTAKQTDALYTAKQTDATETAGERPTVASMEKAATTVGAIPLYAPSLPSFPVPDDLSRKFQEHNLKIASMVPEETNKKENAAQWPTQSSGAHQMHSQGWKALDGTNLQALKTGNAMVHTLSSGLSNAQASNYENTPQFETNNADHAILKMVPNPSQYPRITHSMMPSKASFNYFGKSSLSVIPPKKTKRTTLLISQFDARKNAVLKHRIPISTLSDDPKIQLFEHLFTTEETVQLIDLCYSKSFQSKFKTGSVLPTSVDVEPNETPIVTLVQNRVAIIAAMNPQHLDRMTIEQFEKGQHIPLDHDGSLIDKTAIIFLNEPNSGGEVVFPRINLSVQPQRGTAICWGNAVPGGVTEPRVAYELHGVRIGKQWILKCLFNTAHRM